ncbi:MAG TPA: hypothetical protein DCP53_09700 [Elusimicrobia bacterium]|nr:hypothetical protein [Elusimicrobiota bacterium]
MHIIINVDAFVQLKIYIGNFFHYPKGSEQISLIKHIKVILHIFTRIANNKKSSLLESFCYDFFHVIYYFF